MKDFLDKRLPASGYAELRAQNNTQRRASYLNGTLVRNSSQASGGVCARAVKNGAYGFASSSEYSPEAVSSVVGAAVKNAEFLDGRAKLGKPPFESTGSFSREDGAELDHALPQKYIIDYAGEIDGYIAKKYPSLQSRSVGASCLNMEKLLLTTDGVRAYSFTPRSILGVNLTAEAPDGSSVELYRPFGGFGMFDKALGAPESLFNGIDELCERLMRKREGVYPQPGIKSVILDSSLAGILAHEAVGHTVEADFVLSGSVGGPNLGKKVGSELVTLVDFAHHAYGELCPVPVFTDDEGVLAEDVTLIKDGILLGYMHNRESAAHYGVKPQGNARAYSFSDEPLIRMRNTCILPGHDSLDDMIASLDDGYYFISTGNGQADSTGEFMFGVTSGYEVKNGKLGRPLRDTTISGVAFDVLKTVDMLSDELSWLGGMCGKKQMIPVGMGGPAIKCRINVGGR